MNSLHINRQPVGDFLRSFSGEELYYGSNPGNAGDAAIALGTYQLFDRLGLAPESCEINELSHLKDKTILFGGGGNLVEGRYREMHDVLLRCLKNGNRCILLPHTIFGYEDIVKHAASGELTIFCREETSYRWCAMANGLNTSNIFLDDDLAFQMDPEFLRPFAEREGRGVANCFRTDGESAHLVSLPADNRDISLSWNGALWHDREMTQSVVTTLLTYLSRHEEVRTDRLHVAILGSLLGRRVFLHPNAYYKNRAVYEMSLAKREGTSFIDTASQLHAEDVIDFKYIDQLKGKIAEKDAEIQNWRQVVDVYRHPWNVIRYRLLSRLAFSAGRRRKYRARLDLPK